MRRYPLTNPEQIEALLATFERGDLATRAFAAGYEAGRRARGAPFHSRLRQAWAFSGWMQQLRDEREAQGS